MPDLPSHASPTRPPLLEPDDHVSRYDLDQGRVDPPANLLSPAFTPPATPGTGTPRLQREPAPIPVDPASLKAPRLLDTLPLVNCIVRARIPTVSGAEMFLHLYENDVDGKEHLAIVFGQDIRSRSLDAVVPGETEWDRMARGAYTGRLYPGRTHSREDPREPGSASAETGRDPAPATASAKEPLVRIHSECYTGETAWSARCDCGEQLDEAARLMSLPSSPGGAIVYLRLEGRGIGLGEKLKAYNLQDLGSDTVEANLLLRHPADARSYGLATAILVDLGLGGEGGIRLLTNNPDKVRAVEGPHREVVVKERVPMVPLAWRSAGRRGIHSKELEAYLRAKVSLSRRRPMEGTLMPGRQIGKMGHMIG
jgi:GTP cyclohydrolase II